MSASERKHYVRRSLEQWQVLVDEQASSDLTQHAYCKRHDITLSAFHNAKKRLAQRQINTAGDQRERNEDDFVAVELAAVQRTGIDIELSLGEGVVLRIRR